jgi:hypothetical protein
LPNGEYSEQKDKTPRMRGVISTSQKERHRSGAFEILFFVFQGRRASRFALGYYMSRLQREEL